jgi:sulfite exporter TauE/SafE
MLHCLATCGGMVCSASELAVVLVVLAPVLSSWRVLYLNRGRFKGKA